MAPQDGSGGNNIKMKFDRTAIGTILSPKDE
jgi:hypothetical protein